MSKYTKKYVRPSIFRMIHDILIKKSPDTGLNILKNMYYDTGLTSSTYALRAMQEFVGPKRIVFGSDLPFSEKVVSMVTNDLEKYDRFTKKDFKLINYRNCLELFPQFDIQ